MGFKEMNNEFSFADAVLESSKKHNRSIKNMQKLNKSIDWNCVENILKSHYIVGLYRESADTYILCCVLNASCYKNGSV